MAGRKPIPTPLIDRAKYQKKGYVDNRIEVEQKMILDENPTMPDGLTENAQKIWNETIELYDRLYQATGTRVLCALDQGSLKSYCFYKDILDNLYEEYRQDPTVYQRVVVKSKSKTDNGERTSGTERKIVNPLFDKIKLIETRLTALANELCLTPAGRARMGILIVNANKNDELDDFMDDN